jgi:hypothetical protein
MNSKPMEAQGQPANHESVHKFDPKAIPIIGTNIKIDLTKKNTAVVNVPMASSWDVLTEREAISGDFMEGIQAKSSDQKNHGLQISSDVPLVLEEMEQELEKVSTEDHKSFLKNAGASDAITIFVTNKPLENYLEHKRKLDEGIHELWPRKVLLVCNQNMPTAFPSGLVNYGVFKKTPEPKL